MNALTHPLGSHQARTFDLCKAGGAVAFRFQTSRGVLVVTASLDEFIAKCRGEKDSNGNVFENPAAHAEAPAPRPPKERGYHPRLPAEQLRKYEVAERELAEGKHRFKKAAAAAHGLNYVSFYQWLYNRARFRPERQPVLKPGGRIL